MNEVRNIRDGTFDRHNPDHVYVGRYSGHYRLRAHPLANPYPMRTERDRESVLRSYAAYLEERPDLQEIARGLRGKVLYCWCSPRHCHAEIIALYAVGMYDGMVADATDRTHLPSGATHQEGAGAPPAPARTHGDGETLF